MNVAEAIARDGTERKKEISRLGIQPAKKKCVAILTPTLGSVSMMWHTSMVDLIWPMNCGRIMLPTLDRNGGEIGEMRNRLVDVALKMEESQGIEIGAFFWLDDDVIINRACLLKLLSHLNDDRSIAAGVYFTKGDGGEALIFEGPSCGAAKFAPAADNDAPGEEHWGWSQGLSVVKPEVYKRMRDDLELGLDKYGAPCWYKEPGFGINQDNGALMLGGTEDFHFFHNASRLGYRCLVDCSRLAFGYHYDVTKHQGYPAQQWNQFVRREPVIWNTPKGEVIWE
jgi:hypothetical protein